MRLPILLLAACLCATFLVDDALAQSQVTGVLQLNCCPTCACNANPGSVDTKDVNAIVRKDLRKVNKKMMKKLRKALRELSDIKETNESLKKKNERLRKREDQLEISNAQLAAKVQSVSNKIGSLQTIAGPPGPRGLPGRRGERGRPGRPGDAGAPGRPGRDGQPGGRGPEGPAGPPGRAGGPGSQGPPGNAGSNGPPGPQGPQGNAGPPGPVGPIGARGPSGQDGRQGPPGPSGPPGPRGERGDNGRNGDRGPPGPAGQNGERGANGSPGANGTPGRNGDAGPPGRPGPPGMDGRPGPPGRAGKNASPPPKGYVVEEWPLGGNTNNLAQALKGMLPQYRWVDHRGLMDYGSPQSFATADNRNELFAYKIIGRLQVESPGDYHFTSQSDDGSQVIVNGRMIINNDGLHGMNNVGGDVHLERGWADITVLFFQNYGGAGLRILWQGPGVSNQIAQVYLPEKAKLESIMTQPNPKYGFLAEYRTFNHDIHNEGDAFQGGLSKTKTYTTPFIDFESPGSFDAGQNERFSVVYSGFIYAPTDGTYQFWTGSDDGSMLDIDGQRVVNNDGLHGTDWRQGGIHLSPGRHSFVLRFFQNGGGAYVRFDWQGPGFDRVMTTCFTSYP